MIIVSQDKEHIINFSNVKEIRLGCSGSLKADIFEDYELALGYYKTEERAKEVLQEIVKEYKRGTNSSMIAENEWQEYKNVYEMPEE